MRTDKKRQRRTCASCCRVRSATWSTGWRATTARCERCSRGSRDAAGGAAIARAVDVLPAIRSSRFDLPLTYDAGDLELSVGDVVHAPLGGRDVVAFVISPVRDEPAPSGAQAGHRTPRRSARLRRNGTSPRAVRRGSLRLHARGSVIRGGAGRFGAARARLASSDWGAPRRAALSGRFRSAAALDLGRVARRFRSGRLLRHPDARRIGDRATLLRHVQALVRGGDLRRERRLMDPRTREYRIRTLYEAAVAATGKKAHALLSLVGADVGLPRSDALLAGFSKAVIARALETGALIEREVAPAAIRELNIAPETRAADADQSVALQRIDSFSGSPPFRRDTALRRHRQREDVRLRRGDPTSRPSRRTRDRSGSRDFADSPNGAPVRGGLRAAGRGAAFGPLGARTLRRMAGVSPRRDRRGRRCAQRRLRAAERRSAARRRRVARNVAYKQDVGSALSRRGRRPRAHAARRRCAALGQRDAVGGELRGGPAGKIALDRDAERATNLPLPAVRVVDLAQEFRSGNRRIFGAVLVQALAHGSKRGEKSVLFLNRRGSARVRALPRRAASCRSVPRCSVSLAAHRQRASAALPLLRLSGARSRRCARRAAATTVKEFGIGTEAVVDEVRRLFPQARVLRMDSDSTTHVGDHARILAEFEEAGDVLVGTQMVAKGLDYPTVTLAAVVAADIGLHAADFRAAERSFALIAQVCGRSGRRAPGRSDRANLRARRIPPLRLPRKHDYVDSPNANCKNAQSFGYPPSRRLVYLGVIGRSRTAALAAAEGYAQILRALAGFEVLGPAPYPIARLNGEWRFRIAIKTVKPAALRAAIRKRIMPAAHATRETRLAINVDP